VDALKVVAENNFGDTRSGSLAGPLGLLIILLLAIGTFLLIRNMNARLRRLPESFPDPSQPDPARSQAAGRDSVAGPPLDGPPPGEGEGAGP
jgi:hypothetical protein